MKIADTALTDGEEEKFYSLFGGGDICDDLFVEHIIPVYKNVKYDGIIKVDTNNADKIDMDISTRRLLFVLNRFIRCLLRRMEMWHLAVCIRLRVFLEMSTMKT